MKKKMKEYILQYNKGGFTYKELEWELLNLFSVINWVDFTERKPDVEDTYYVYPDKYHYTAEYHKYGKWAGKWTVDDQNGYEVEIHVDYWKAIIPPCL